jgi:translation initiation factor 1 (eIF-1/SUI1)
MSAGKKKKSGDSWDSGQISLGGGDKFSLSIGDVIGKHVIEPAPADYPAEDAARNSKKSNKASKEPVSRDEFSTFLAGAQQAALHKETAGRGGRTVITISFRPQPDAGTANALAAAMRKALGCGAHVEHANVVLHGDIKDRAAAWLSRGGVRKVV